MNQWQFPLSSPIPVVSVVSSQNLFSFGVRAPLSELLLLPLVFRSKTLKGELRGKSEVILYSWPILSYSIFDNSFLP